MKRQDLTGKRFDFLCVVSKSDDYISPQGKHFSAWECICDCGKTIVVRGDSLKNGHTKSCGCLKAQENAKRIKHGDKRKNGTHRLYSIWSNMIQRCQNQNRPDYKYYGGRGIVVCNEWKEYDTFKRWAFENGYLDGLTLDRIDPDRNYCSENCRWVTIKSQQNNKRSNHLLTYMGETLDISQWSEKTGIPYGTIRSRVNILGWSDEKAITAPNHRGVSA